MMLPGSFIVTPLQGADYTIAEAAQSTIVRCDGTLSGIFTVTIGSFMETPVVGTIVGVLVEDTLFPPVTCLWQLKPGVLADPVALYPNEIAYWVFGAGTGWSPLSKGRAALTGAGPTTSFDPVDVWQLARDGLSQINETNLVFNGGGDPVWTPGPVYQGWSQGSGQYWSNANASLQITTGLSIFCWVRMTSLSGTQTLIAHEGAGATSADNANYALKFVSGVLTFIQESGTKVQDTAALTDFDFPLHEWVHIGAVRDVSADDVSLYVNGQSNPNVSGMTPPTGGGSGVFTIGALTGGTQELDGKVQGVKILPGPVSATNAVKEYRSTSGAA